MIFRIITCLALAGSTVFAQSATLQIDGPREVETGVLVRISANTQAKETPFWIVLEPTDLDYEQVDGGRRLLFSSGCRETSITVMLLAQQVVESRIVTRQIRRTIQVSDEAASNAPAKPPLVDEPSLESPLFAAVIDAWPKIETDAAKELSGAIAKNFEEIAKKCEAGEFEQIPSVWKELSSLNRETLQIETEAWVPLATAVQQEFQQLNLPDAASHAPHLRAAAKGIRQAFDQQTKSESIEGTRQ